MKRLRNYEHCAGWMLAGKNVHRVGSTDARTSCKIGSHDSSSDERKYDVAAYAARVGLENLLHC